MVKTTVKSDERNTGPSVEAGRSSRKRRGTFFCLHHAENTTHNTNDCKVLLKAQVDRMASAHANKGAGKYGKNRNSENKRELESFKSEIVRSVVKSLTTPQQASTKRRKFKNLDRFNMETFRNLSVSSYNDSNSGDGASDDSSSTS